MQSEINIPSSYLEFRKEVFLKKFIAETSSELTKLVASFWSPRQYLVQDCVSGHTDEPPIKPLFYSSCSFCYRNHESRMQRMVVPLAEWSWVLDNIVWRKHQEGLTNPARLLGEK